MYFFIAVFLIAAIIILNIYAKRDPISKDKIIHSVEIDRDLAEPGETFGIVSKIENDSSHSMGRVYLTNVVDNGIEIQDKVYTIKYVKGKKNVIIRTSVKGRRIKEITTLAHVDKRGIYKLDSFKLDCLDFSGFHTSYYNKPSLEKIVIAPKRVNRDFLSKLVVQGYGDENAKRGFIDDETTIRTYGEYTGHEPMRHINWKKSAQIGEFVVKQFEPMGTNVTTIVFDLGDCVNSIPGTISNELFEYSVSMLREILEYLEAKRTKYRLITNVNSKSIKNLTYSCSPTGKKTRRQMLYMLGEMSCAPGDYYCTSKDLLNFAIKNSYNAPFAYLAARNRANITLSLKKVMKVKGIDIIELYAEDYYKPQKEEAVNAIKSKQIVH